MLLSTNQRVYLDVALLYWQIVRNVDVMAFLLRKAMEDAIEAQLPVACLLLLHCRGYLLRIINLLIVHI